MNAAPRSRRVVALLSTLGLVVGCATGTARRPAADPSSATAAPAPPPARPQAPPEIPALPPLPAGGGPLHPVSPLSAAEAPIRTVARVTIGAVGDVLMHEAVKRSAETHGAGSPDSGYSWLFAPIADLLAEPDLTFANLETPVAPGARGGVRPFVFNAPPAVIAALQRSGVDLVSVANNHAFDQGRPGFDETLRWLASAGMAQVGAGPPDRAAGPVILERNGFRLAFLGYTYGMNQDGNACPTGVPECAVAASLDRNRVVEDVRAAAAEGDAVIVSLHWGVEYEQQPRSEDVELARRIADAGAHVILGHHPHVLQPVELYRRADGQVAVIAYSLGNFISNQSRNFVPGVTPASIAATRDAALVRVALARRDYGRGVVRVEVAGADFLPLWTENDTARIDRRREPSRRPAIRVVALDRAIAEVRAEMATIPEPVPPEQELRWIELRKREALYLSRRSTIAQLLGEDLLRSLSPDELAAPVTPGASR